MLAGLSAGAMCWFEARRLDVERAARRRSTGSACCPGSLSVHRDGEPERLPVYLDAVRARRRCPPGWAADDGVGLLFRDARARARRVVAARRRARSRVDAEGVHELAGRVPRRRAPRRAPRRPFEVIELRSRAAAGQHDLEREELGPAR